MASQLRLGAEFSPATQDKWRELVDGVLKGAAFDTLVSKTYDGLSIAPIYPRARDADLVTGRASSTPWQIMQRVDHPDAVAANAQALTDLENGATGLTLVFAGAHGAYGFGLEPMRAALDRVFEGIHLDAGINIEFQIGAQTSNIPQLFADLLRERDIGCADVQARFGFDPIGNAAVAGRSSYHWTEIAKSLGPASAEVAGLGFKGPFAVADGRVIHDAGGSEAQELAFVLASGVAYLRALEEAGVEPDRARYMIYARLSADADQFMTLAKFRALRLLWAHIETSCGLAPRSLFVAADTAWRMLTQRDPYVNVLRATIASFGAALGGASSINVLPHTLALGLPDALARRIARNTQLILLEESNLEKVTDPAAGAGGFENLTAELSKAAWSLFQEIEKAGGIFAALECDLLQDRVIAVRAARDRNIARRKDVLTGASEFANLQEAPVKVLDRKPKGAAPRDEAKIIFPAIAPIRLSEPFERLRDRSDRFLASTGARPKIFLANLGAAADFTARATFAKSLFEAGGIQAIDGKGGEDPVAVATAFKESGASLVCLCSSDKVYVRLAGAAAQALRAAGARHIYMAGRPDEQETALRAAGLTSFVFAGDDALVTLNEAYTRMGLS